MSGSLIQRMLWQTDSGQIMDGDRRYLMMRADVLMGVFRNLPAQLQHQALQAIQQSVREQGGKSAKAYFASLNNNPSLLLKTITEFSPQLGWGVWEMQQQGDCLSVKVENSPFAYGFGDSKQPVCHPIVGMLETVGELVLGGPVEVHETQCQAQGHTHCAFHAKSIT